MNTNYETMTLEEKREAAKKVIESAKIKVANQMESARLDSILTGDLATLMAKQAMETENSNKLRAVEMTCSGIVENAPIFDKTARENKKWRPSKVFGLGPQIGQLYSIISGIQYSAGAHKTLMLAQYSGLTEDLIEKTLDAFGQPAYFSKYGSIVPQKNYDFTIMEQCVNLLEEALDVTINKDKFTAETMKQIFDSARLTAETKDAEFKRALELGDINTEA